MSQAQKSPITPPEVEAIMDRLVAQRRENLEFHQNYQEETLQFLCVKEGEPEKLAHALGDLLPPYQIPGQWRVLDRLPRLVGHLYLRGLAVCGGMLFYFTDLGKLGGFLRVLFGAAGAPLWDSRTELTLLNHLFWLVLAAVFCMPVVRRVKEFAAQRLSGGKLAISLAAQTALNLGLLALCTAQLVGQSYNPFLYYRF